MAKAFPGLYRADQWQALDVRELDVWEREAAIEQIRREIDDLSRIRLAMNGSPEDYNRRIHDLEMALARAEGAEDEVYADSWDYLKSQGRG